MYHYANILFTGKSCNLRCYDCIGQRPELQNLPYNLDVFPPANIDALIEQVNFGIKDLAFTGTNIDPQLYKHEVALINYIRERLTFKSNLSLHTNGMLALSKMDVFNAYDKASISFPSFDPKLFWYVTKSKIVPDLARILKEATIPVKLSMLVTPYNVGDISNYIKRAADLGVKRIVIRKLKGKDDLFPIEKKFPFWAKEPIKFVLGWPVYDIDGVEVTICGFDGSTAKGLFLFSDGAIKDRLI
jgi:MoaA/NifB/PqqE/SkfB family radical SAM enzyme